MIFVFISWRHLWEIVTCKPYYHFPDKELHGTNSLMVITNIQGDEPCKTALERQVQTLAAAMDRLTKQNHDLEEQLH